MNERKLRTHAVDGTREGVYGGAAIAVSQYLLAHAPVLREILGGDVMALSVISGVLITGAKAARNFVRKNWGKALGGIV